MSPLTYESSSTWPAPCMVSQGQFQLRMQVPLPAIWITSLSGIAGLSLCPSLFFLFLFSETGASRFDGVQTSFDRKKALINCANRTFIIRP